MAKKICLYGILSAVCVVFGFIEHFILLDFIAPGIKIGLSNTVALLLVYFKDIKGAFAVNIVRILLSAVLFSSPSSLIFSLPAGILSLFAMCLVLYSKAFSVIGASIFGAVIHNITQMVCAVFLFGRGILYYFPLLLLSALVCGSFVGFTVKLLAPKLYKKFKF